MRRLPALCVALLAALALPGCNGPGIPDPCPPPPPMPAPAERPQVAADAGPDLEVATGDSVFMDASESRDLAGRPLTYHWAQLEGPCVELDTSDPVRPTFEAPRVPEGGAVLRFRLVVQAGEEHSHPAFANVFVGRTEAGSAT